MIPNPDEMLFCILQDGAVMDGAHGLAIGTTEAEAWERAIDQCERWAIELAKDRGKTVARCAIMVLNP